MYYCDLYVILNLIQNLLILFVYVWSFLSFYIANKKKENFTKKEKPLRVIYALRAFKLNGWILQLHLQLQNHFSLANLRFALQTVLGFTIPLLFPPQLGRIGGEQIHSEPIEVSNQCLRNSNRATAVWGLKVRVQSLWLSNTID